MLDSLMMKKMVAQLKTNAACVVNSSPRKVAGVHSDKTTQNSSTTSSGIGDDTRNYFQSC